MEGTVTTRRLSLWRRLGRSNRLFPRKLKLTRDGKLLLFLTLAVGFAAINTGNNLLYLVLGLLISLIVVSGILSELALRRVVAEIRPPRSIFAGCPTLVGAYITNTKRRLAAFSIEVELVVDTAGVEQRPAHVTHLHGRESATSSLDIVFPRRGLYESPGLIVATRFPFGFFRKSRFFPELRELVVFPAVHDIEAGELPRERIGETTHRASQGRGDEFYALREIRPGDDYRDIYWKVSARLGALVVRSFEEPTRRQVSLCFANVVPDEHPETLRRMEAAVGAVASLARHYAQRGYRVGLQTLERTTGQDVGTEHLRDMLRHLALMPILVADGSQPVKLPGAGADRVLLRHPLQRAIPVEGAFGGTVTIGLDATKATRAGGGGS